MSVDDGAAVVRLVNLTPHPVNIRIGDIEVALPASAAPARLTGAVEDVGRVRFEGVDVPLVQQRFTGIEGLPAAAAGVHLIVSQLVVDFVADRADLVTPTDLVRDDAGNVIACRALARRAH